MAAMAADGLATAPAPPSKQPRNPISLQQIEIVAVRSSAFFGLIFGLQTLPFVLGQVSAMKVTWAYGMIIAIFGGLVASVFAVMFRSLSRLVRGINAYIAIVYLLSLLLWPLAIRDPEVATIDKPWLWYLCTLATATAAVAFSVWVSSLYLVVTPIIYGFIHTTPAGGSASWDLSFLDVVYAIILGGAVLVILTLLRQTAASVDAAQSTALARYAHAVRQHATELERVQVDAIVHDSVLTTLLSAARAYTPEAQELAASMARNTIGHLRDAAEIVPDDATTISMRDVAARIMMAASDLASHFEVRSWEVSSRAIPVQAAEAIFSASVQAMVNSVQHAGAGRSVARWISVNSPSAESIRVDIGDTGSGFDVQAVPRERLGLRVSIVDRVVSAGGEVEVDSILGEGTVITVHWPARDHGTGPDHGVNPGADAATPPLDPITGVTRIATASGSIRFAPSGLPPGHEYSSPGHEFASSGHEYSPPGHEYSSSGHEFPSPGHELPGHDGEAPS